MRVIGNYMRVKSAFTGEDMFTSVNGVISMYLDTIEGYDIKEGETPSNMHKVRALVLVYSSDYSVYINIKERRDVMNAVLGCNSHEPWFGGSEVEQ